MVFCKQRNSFGNFYSFDINRFKSNVHSTVFPGAPAGLHYPGDPGFPGKTGMRTVWSNVEPRVGLSYDPKGDGRTAIRAGYNRFMTAATTGFAQLYNPTALTSFNLPWTDLNGDDIAQGERGCVYQAPGCEINFATLPANFGVRSLARFDPGLQRPYQLAFNLGASHEVLPGVAFTAEWFHSTFKDLIARNNVALSASDYTAVQVYNPVTGGSVTAYNLAAAKGSAVDYLDSNDPDLKRTYDGIELNVNARLPKGARMFGGLSTERTLANICSAAKNNPNLLAFCDQTDRVVAAGRPDCEYCGRPVDLEGHFCPRMN